MPYTPNQWIDGDTSRPLSAARLAHMETQYDAAMADVPDAIEDALTVDGPVKTQLEATMDEAVAASVYERNGRPFYSNVPRPRPFDDATGWYNLRGEHLRKSKSRLAMVRQGTGSLNVAGIGHSIIAGVGATQGVTDWMQQLCDILTDAGYPQRGTGLVSPYKGVAGDLRYTVGAGWNSLHPGSAVRLNSTTTNPLVFTGGDGTVVEVFYADHQTGYKFTVSIDSGTPVEVNSVGGGGNRWNVYRVTGLSNGSHTVTITRSTASAIIFGVNVRKDTASHGVNLWNAGLGGAKIADLTQGPTTWFTNASMAGTAEPNGFGAHLAFLMIQSNDAAAATNVGAWTADVQTAIDRITAGGADLVLMADPASGSYSQTPYAEALYGLADANDLPVFDVQQRFGTQAQGNANGQYADFVHPSAAGYAQVARGIAQALLA